VRRLAEHDRGNARRGGEAGGAAEARLATSLYALAETLRLGRAIFRQARHAAPLARRIIILTTARETQVSNAAAARLAALWRSHGGNVEEPQFAAELAIPHNAIDPAADPAKKAIVYARMLELLGEE